jgi:prophage DNA circulation protein
MDKADAKEAQPIVNTVLDVLLGWTPTYGRNGAEMRAAVGATKAYALQLLQTDQIDLAVTRCFNLAFDNGINLQQMEAVRETAAAQAATTIGAIMVRDMMVELSLAVIGQMIANMTFTSRADVDLVKVRVNAVYEEMEATLASRMDSMTWRAVLKLQAAIIQHLTETARPLPRMLAYRFNLVLPSLSLGQRLYADAGRADELVKENKIVHPAFCLREGRALSA